jgi:hypothetical protein
LEKGEPKQLAPSHLLLDAKLQEQGDKKELPATAFLFEMLRSCLIVLFSYISTKYNCQICPPSPFLIPYLISLSYVKKQKKRKSLGLRHHVSFLSGRDLFQCKLFA